MWGYGNAGGLGYGSSFGLGGILMLIFWALVIWAIVVLVRGLSGGGCCGSRLGGGDGHRKNNALDIIKERYAKGEISKDELEEMKRNLQ